MSDNPQVTVWNNTVGGAWAEHADHFDAMLQQFGDAVLALLDVAAHERVVDIGCGAGATTLQLAAIAAEAVGLDLSVPMLATARQRAAAAGVGNASFVEADVEAVPFGEAAFDVAFSRFGVMFFNDPVRAFRHIRQSMVAGGRLGFVCYDGPEANPFITVPLKAAAAHIPVRPAPAPGSPGVFGMADRAWTTGVLTEAGFADIRIRSGPGSFTLGSAHDLHGLAQRVLQQNPAAAVGLGTVSPDVQHAAVAATADALAEHVVGDHVVLGAGSWVVTARA